MRENGRNILVHWVLGLTLWVLALPIAFEALAADMPSRSCWEVYSKLARTEEDSRGWGAESLCQLQKFIVLGSSSPSCAQLEARLSRMSKPLGEAFHGLRNLPPEVLSGERAPDFRTVQTVRKIRENLTRGLEELRRKKKLSWLPELAPRIQQAYRNLDFERKAALNLVGEPLTGSANLEYLNRRQLARELAELDRLLPPELRLPIPKVPFEAVERTLNAQARQNTALAKKRFDEIYSTTGFRDHEEFKAAMREASPRARKLIELFDRAEDPDNKELEVVIYSKERSREGIARGGIVNYEVTGISGGGFYDATDVRNRRRVEATLEGLTDEEYARVDPLLRPTYGVLRALNQGDGKIISTPPWYGSDAWILKRKNVQDRMTLFRNDSFRALVGNSTFFRPKDENWRTRFIPWDYRHLLIPNLLGKNEHFSDLFATHVRWNPEEAAALKDKGFFESGVGQYVETQIRGLIRPEDIEAFEFAPPPASEPPSPEFVQELRKHGIQIRIRTHEGVKEWDPDRGIAR